MDLNYEKYKKIKELKRKRDKYIKNKGFSLFNFLNMQYNLINYVESEKIFWERFLKDMIYKYDFFEKRINKSNSIQELKNIEIEFDNLKKYMNNN